MNTTTNQGQNENQKNGFQLYDLYFQPLEKSFNYETFQEIEDDIQRHIDKKAKSVIIQFNKLVLTFNIKARNDTNLLGRDYDLEFEHLEDA